MNNNYTMSNKELLFAKKVFEENAMIRDWNPEYVHCQIPTKKNGDILVHFQRTYYPNPKEKAQNMCNIEMFVVCYNQDSAFSKVSFTQHYKVIEGSVDIENIQEDYLNDKLDKLHEILRKLNEDQVPELDEERLRVYAELYDINKKLKALEGGE